MIDEKRLSQFKVVYKTSGHGDEAPHICDEGAYYDRRGLDELLRLARLGLWAEKHGVPAAKQYAEMQDWGYDHSLNGDCDYGFRAREALAALPQPIQDCPPEKAP